MVGRWRVPLFFWGLGLFTLLVLLYNIPQTKNLDAAVWLFYAALVALMLNLGTALSEGVASPASTAGLMAYLALSTDRSASAALWCVTAGALIGNVVWLLRTLPTRQLRREFARVIKSVTVGIAQLTLGLVVGGWFYRQSGGTLPLDSLDDSDIVPLIVLIITYLTVYLGILFLEAYLSRHMTPRTVVQRWEAGVESILLPLPFAVVGAVAYHDLSRLAFVILIGGLLIIVTGVNLLSRTRARFREQVIELSSLSAVSQSMHTNMDLNALLDVVYEQVSLLLGANNFMVALFDPNRNMLYFPLNVQDGRRVPLEPRETENGLIEHVIRQKTPLLLPDQVLHRAELMGLRAPSVPVYSWLAVPLLAPDRVLGCMVTYANAPEQRFTQKDLQLFTTIAAQTGIATDNAQLYGQSRDRAVQLATLNNVATILSGTLNVQQVLDLAGSSAVAVASSNAVALYLWWGEMRSSLSLVRYTGLSEEFAANPARPLLLDIDDLQRRRQPVIVTDAHIDQRTHEIREDMDREDKRAWVEFLLRKGDELLGVLVFFYNEPRYFSKEEIELLRNFTNLAALAISNARLYTQTDEALKRRVEHLSALADISRELTSTLNLQGLFQLVLDRAIEATRSRTGVLLLRPESSDALPSLVAYRGFAPDAFDQVSPLVGPVARTYETANPTLISDVTQDRDYIPLDGGTRAQLNVPIMYEGRVLGVISLGSDHPATYGQDDLSFVTQLTTQARIAIDNARLFRRIEIARDRLQVILDSMKEGVILISSEGQITLANPRVRLLLELDPHQITGESVADLVCDESLGLAERLGMGTEALLSLVRRLGEGQWDESTHSGGRVTFQVATPSKLRFIDRTNAPVRDESGRTIGVLMVFSDVTEERELAQAREDLSSMIVHDLRGPLTAVTTSLKLLNEIAPPDDSLGRTIQQTTDMSLRAVRKLLNLVDSLLDVSKLESGIIALEREPTRLLPLCSAVVDEYSPLFEELEIDILLRVADDLPLLNTDADKIERVFLNLVDNAVKFTPSGGHVVIEAYPPGVKDVEPGFIRVEVRDTGPGIPDEYKERLFDRFTQVDGQHGRRRGTGLGLTFCRLAVEAHGGRIWVENNPQGGAIFAFTLPTVELGGAPDGSD
jgi:NtrC-family two-component system sensor histidine kinase KinB